MSSISSSGKGDSSKESLGQKTIKGFGWRFASIATKFFANFGIGVVLARILPPEDFGLVGLAMIAVGLGKLFADLGLGPALIQRETLTERHVRVGFSISLLAGVVLAIAGYLAAPLVASLLKDVRVTPILRVLTLAFVFSGFNIVSQALLQRRMDFRALMFIGLASYVVGYGGVGISLALQGYGVWSLVYASLTQATLNAALSYAVVRHSLMPLLALEETRDLASFSVGMSLTQITNYFALQGDYFVVGRLLGPNALGLYTRAYNLMKLPLSYFVSTLSSVLFPAAARIQSDPFRFQRVYLQSSTATNLITIPAMTGIVILSPELIRGVYGPQWTGAILPLQILGAFGVLRASYNNASAFVRAKGHVYKLFMSQAVYGALVVVGSWWAAGSWGLSGVALAVGLSITVMWAIVVFISNRLTATPLLTFLRTILPGSLVALPVGLAAAGIKWTGHALGTPDLLILLTASLGGAMTALSLVLLLPPRLLGPTLSSLVITVASKSPYLRRLLPNSFVAKHTADHEHLQT